MHFFHCVAAVDFHGDFAQVHLCGNLLVHQAFDGKGHHFFFTSRQRLVMGMQIRKLLLGFPAPDIGLQCG
ncbi:hypothetical protein D3C75_1322300 [compost metagenome]